MPYKNTNLSFNQTIYFWVTRGEQFGVNETYAYRKSSPIKWKPNTLIEYGQGISILEGYPLSVWGGQTLVKNDSKRWGYKERYERTFT